MHLSNEMFVSATANNKHRIPLPHLDAGLIALIALLVMLITEIAWGFSLFASDKWKKSRKGIAIAAFFAMIMPSVWNAMYPN